MVTGPRKTPARAFCLSGAAARPQPNLTRASRLTHHGAGHPFHRGMTLGVLARVASRGLFHTLATPVRDSPRPRRAARYPPALADSQHAPYRPATTEHSSSPPA